MVLEVEGPVMEEDSALEAGVTALEADDLVSGPGLTLTSCRILGISLNLSVFQTPRL